METSEARRYTSVSRDERAYSEPLKLAMLQIRGWLVVRDAELVVVNDPALQASLTSLRRAAVGRAPPYGDIARRSTNF